MDDFKGEFCNQGKYPLLTTINYYLMKKRSNVKLPDASMNWISSNKEKLKKKSGDFLNR